MTANPSYFKALLAEAINGNDMAWKLMSWGQSLSQTSEHLSFHGDSYGKSTADVTLDGDIL